DIPRPDTPALWISTSMPSCATAAARLAICAPSRTSRACSTTSPASAPSAPGRAGVRVVACTRQPSAAYWRASARPMPRLAPIIMTVDMVPSPHSYRAWCLKGRCRRSGVRLPHQLRTMVKDWQHFVGVSCRQIEHQAGYPSIAIALDQVKILGHAEDGNRDGRGVTPGRGGHLLEGRQEPKHIAVGRTARVRHPPVAIGDGAACTIGIGAADDHRWVRLLDRLGP